MAKMTKLQLLSQKTYGYLTPKAWKYIRDMQKKTGESFSTLINELRRTHKLPEKNPAIKHRIITKKPSARLKARRRKDTVKGYFPNPKQRKELSVFDRHQLAIARKTLTYSDAGARIMGGPTKAEAREIIKRVTGKYPIEKNPVKRKSPNVKRRVIRKIIAKRITRARRHVAPKGATKFEFQSVGSTGKIKSMGVYASSLAKAKSFGKRLANALQMKIGVRKVGARGR